MSELKDKLFYDNTNVYDVVDEQEVAKINDYSVGYMEFLAKAKTEREAVSEGIKMAEAEGFVPYTMGMEVVPGGKYYYNNRGKSLVAFVVGTESTCVHTF